jgi:xanthine dehydrogenase iron-sulfur cluster and FAD-binding subunit A
MKGQVDTIALAFTLNRRPLHVRTGSTTRLVDLLREDLRLTGVKEGCGTGECGSCTVIMNGKAVASCLMMAYQADGSVVETVEGLSDEGRLHPLQENFLERGAVQCGFCTPGMLLAAKAALDSGPLPGAQAVREALSGNLCRCTGYAKIVQAVLKAGPAHPPEPLPPATQGAAPSYYCPRSLEEALEILAQREGEVRPIAGGTEILLRAREGSVDLGALFDVSNVPELKGIEERDDGILVGAASSHSEIAASAVLKLWAPTLAEASASLGGPQIRNRGTLGGNIATGSPLSDTIPALLVSEAVVDLVSVSSRRGVPIEDFFDAPGSTVLARDELIVGVTIPKRPGVRGAFLRVGQRQSLSWAKVSVAAAMTFRQGRPDWARVAIGAVGPRVVRATETEKALLSGGHEGLRKAREAIGAEAAAHTDRRSSEDYRREIAGVLLERAVRRLSEA